MIKPISFRPQFIPLIKAGEKTVTRRVTTKLKARDICWFKGGRTGKKEGYIKIIGKSKEYLTDMTAFYNNEIEELKDEGFKSLKDFIDLWNNLNKKGFRWNDNPMVYRIKFKYIGEKL